jgi:methylglutaconyl-CoA hydratase
MTRYHTINIRHENGIETITLNRPEKRNALNSQLILELTQALDAAAESKSGVVILTGSGSAFCAGLDLEHLQSMTAKTPEG